MGEKNVQQRTLRAFVAKTRVISAVYRGGIKNVNQVRGDEACVTRSDDIFLGTVEKSGEEKWTVPVGINGHDVMFRVDTEADVSVMTKTTFDSNFSTNKLQPAPKTIRGADHNVINTYGCFLANVTFKDKQCSEQIYVFERATNFLSCKASHALGIVSFVGVVAEKSILNFSVGDDGRGLRYQTR